MRKLSDITRKLLVKVDEESDPRYGCEPSKRPIGDHLRFGVVNLDKPSGPTSHEVVAWVKRLLKVGHAGHSGTLDPKVTGVLPIGLEEATKVIGVLLLSEKEYVCVLRLHGDVSEDKVRKILEEFVGEVYQRPPLRSSVSRLTRIRRIYYIRDLEFNGRYVLFRVGCQSGTYIRKLCYDIGEALGVGAHMAELRRTRSGVFTENEGMVTLYDLREAVDALCERGDESGLRRCILPMEFAVGGLPRVFIRDSAVDSICHGAWLAVPGIAKLDSGIVPKRMVGLFSLKGELVGLGRAVMSSEEVLAVDRGVAFETVRVVMPAGLYPRLWPSHSHR
ncbi:MAG: RNA-guided pseudouridylation complex pseudouridine synthase subunit Cbf5 [Candidatus Bathyarchaeia archaeon]